MSNMNRFITPITFAVGLTLSASCALAQEASEAALRQPLPTTTLNVGIHNIHVELAQTDAQRSTGLMNRPQLGEHQGMLFVFDSLDKQCFWMKNTRVPLSIAFLADDGSITHIDDMQPQSLASHCSPKLVRLALEVNQGWFAKRGVKVGMKLSGAVFQNSPTTSKN
jgi:uncharacterized protein